MYSSRLNRAEERRNMRKAVLLIFATIAILVAGIVLGIPVLTRTAMFMGSLNSKNAIADKIDNIPPGPPQIALAYDATNSATQTISGLSEPGSTVYLSQNSHEAGNVVTDNDGTFEFRNVILTKGDNLFTAIALDQSSNKSLISSSVHLTYSSDPPKLEITSPTDHQSITDKSSVNLLGTTQNVSRLTVNDRTIIIGSNGKFNTMYSLNPGENVLVFTATDSSGNQARKELTVNYSP